jgi:hypothetical protein
MFITMYSIVGLAFAGLMTYALTGEPPKELLDYTHPRTGEKDKDGKDKRLNTMFYTREFMAIYMHTQQKGLAAGLADTVMNKAAPSFGLVKAWVTGLDSLENEIRDPDANMYKKLQQTLLHSMYAIEPISIASLKQGSPDGGLFSTIGANPLAAGLTVLGFGPAPKYVTDTLLEAEIKGTFLKYFGRKQTPYEKVEYSADARKVRGLYEAGYYNDYDVAFDKMVEKHDLYPDEIKRLRRSIEEGSDPMLSMFARLPPSMQTKLMDKMTQEELDIYQPHSNKARLRDQYEQPEKEE